MSDSDDICRIATPFIEAVVFFEPEWCEVIVPGPPGPVAIDEEAWVTLLG